MAQRLPDSSFNRVFGNPNVAASEEGKPSVHELFSAAMRDELRLSDFEEALQALHGIRITPAAARLLASVDATSGRLSFQQFQRALQDNSDADQTGAGLRTNFTDQASAIITDNSGEAAPGAAFPGGKVKTDISLDSFVKQTKRMSAGQARGGFTDNPVIPTNKASMGNPLVQERRSSNGQDVGDEQREVAGTATRMFASGELCRREYEGFLANNGIMLSHDSELQRLIISHEKTGDGSFVQLSRALQRELAKDADAVAVANTLTKAVAHNSVAAAGVKAYG